MFIKATLKCALGISSSFYFIKMLLSGNSSTINESTTCYSTTCYNAYRQNPWVSHIPHIEKEQGFS